MASLQDDFWPAIFHDDTGCGTLDYAHSVESRSARISSCFLELEKMNQDLESKLRNDFNNILNSMDRLSLSPASQPVLPPLNPPTRTISSIHNSSFTIAAYIWLLENIANPYPSSTTKAYLAQQYNVSLSAVNSWFVGARRRMGWTALCRDYFNNCRADASDAAYRALVNEDPNCPLPPDVIHAFISVKVAAEGLCSSTFTKSALAGDLDAVVRDMTDQDAISVGEWKRCKFKGVAESPEASEAELQNKKPVEQHYYPSPDSSCYSSPVPPLDESLTDDSEEEAEVSPPILAGRKRRLSCSESGHTIPALTTKRIKHLSPSISSPVEACLSSPSTSSEELSATHSHNQKPCSRSIPQSSTNISTSRKRCLSDADTTGIPKRPRGSTAGPRLHAVSDPLPLSTPESDHTIDEWFNSTFDALFSLPPPVDVIEPDLLAQLEVELFNDYNIPEESQTRPFKSLNPPTGDQASTSVDLSVLDEFLKSLETGGFVAPSDIVDPAVTISAADSITQDLLSSSESIDWTALLNGQASEPSLESLFVQSHTDSLPLPEIDLSILQLP